MISIGKYGSFHANSIVSRPYYLTFEIVDARGTSLRVVPAAELCEDIHENDVAVYDQEIEESLVGNDGTKNEIINADDKVVMRTNRDVVDDTSRQRLTMSQIENMKKTELGSGKNLVARILESHSALDQKTAFGLAKYTLRKAKKFLKRFTVLPLDVPLLANWILFEKEPQKIMEIREEILALTGSWLNVHCVGEDIHDRISNGPSSHGNGRWLVVDETGGLLVAAVAEKINVLYRQQESPTDDAVELVQEINGVNISPTHSGSSPEIIAKKPNFSKKTSTSVENNTITLIHANSQPNLSLLGYFGFDAANPDTTHPLYAHLRTLSWLQLLSPEEDAGYAEPEAVPDEILRAFKSGKKSNYYRKRRRWERIRSVMHETRDGEFDGLIVASVMDIATILHHAVPLLRGAAQVVVYSPNIEPLAELADYYSTSRRTAYLADNISEDSVPNDDFPVNPTLLLAPHIQTARCRTWQVLPGRTHPNMTVRGGAEGYVFTATRVLPAEGKIQARGPNKRRKAVSSCESRLKQETQVSEIEEASKPEQDAAQEQRHELAIAC